MSDTIPLIGGAPPISDKDVWEIKLVLTRIEERMAAGAEAAEHRHANMRAALDNFVPRREIEQTFAGLTVRLSSVEADLDERPDAKCIAEIERRLGKIESNQERVIWAVLSTVALTVASLFGVSIKR